LLSQFSASIRSGEAFELIEPASAISTPLNSKEFQVLVIDIPASTLKTLGLVALGKDMIPLCKHGEDMICKMSLFS
jgi:hypothetical protein